MQLVDPGSGIRLMRNVSSFSYGIGVKTHPRSVLLKFDVLGQSLWSFAPVSSYVLNQFHRAHALDAERGTTQTCMLYQSAVAFPT